MRTKRVAIVFSVDAEIDKYEGGLHEALCRAIHERDREAEEQLTRHIYDIEELQSLLDRLADTDGAPKGSFSSDRPLQSGRGDD